MTGKSARPDGSVKLTGSFRTYAYSFTPPASPIGSSEMSRAQTTKVECLRRVALGGREDPEALADAQQVMARYVTHDNTARPHSALHHLTQRIACSGPPTSTPSSLPGPRPVARQRPHAARTGRRSAPPAPAPSLVRNPESLISA